VVNVSISATHLLRAGAMSPLRSCLIGVLAAFSLSFTTASAGSRENNPVLTHPSAASTEPLSFIVKFRSSSPVATARAQTHGAVTQAVVATTVRDVQSLAQRSSVALGNSRRITNGLHLMQVTPGQGESEAAVLARLRADPAVESAEVDQRRYPHALPNDPLFSNQWYELNNQPAAIDAVAAWDITTGLTNVVIADLDTGVRFDHPDLGAKLLTGYDFITDPVVANDGDGRDADASDPGDWVTAADVSTSTFSGCTVSDSSWHGTRTAGILGAIANNSTGIAGISWGVRILPVRVLGKCLGRDSDILDGMRWAAGLHVDGVPDNTHPAQIINMSLGGTGSCASYQQTVINEVLAQGVLIVVSAGNEGGPVDSPANCVGVAGVAGLRNVGTKVGFSSLGPQVALSAPAGNCVNSSGACVYPIDTTSNAGMTTPTINGYTDQLNPSLGTSFSAPIVSGIAALMVSVNSHLTAPQLIARLKEGSAAFPVSSDTTIPNCHVPANSSDLQTTECNCTTQTCGTGMANAPGALKAALRPIAAIQVPAKVASGQNVTLSAVGSAAACGHSIATYAWTIVAPSNVPVQGANMPDAIVVAPSSGSITLQVTVTDDAGLTDTAQVTISSTTATTSAPSAASKGSCPAPAAPIVVTVAPNAVTLVAGASQTFTAKLTNTQNTAVIWQVKGVTGDNSSVGTISTAGVYTAPTGISAALNVTVTAVSAADPDQSGSAAVTVNPTAGGPSSLSGGGSAGSGGGTGTGSGSNSGSGSGSAGSTTSTPGGGGGGAMDAATLLACGVLAIGAAQRRRTRCQINRSAASNQDFCALR
jgi:serine protease